MDDQQIGGRTAAFEQLATQVLQDLPATEALQVVCRAHAADVQALGAQQAAALRVVEQVAADARGHDDVLRHVTERVSQELVYGAHMRARVEHLGYIVDELRRAITEHLDSDSVPITILDRLLTHQAPAADFPPTIVALTVDHRWSTAWMVDPDGAQTARPMVGWAAVVQGPARATTWEPAILDGQTVTAPALLPGQWIVTRTT